MSTMELLKAQAALERAKVEAQGPAIWIDDQAEPQASSIKHPALTDSGRRMQRKRRREANARLFWKLRLKTGTDNLELIADALANAPAIVEDQRKIIIAELSDFAAAYPRRAEAFATKNTKSHE